MKKFLLGVSSLALAGVFAFSGCSCSKTGTYKFEKVEIKIGDETKTYTCTTEEKNSNLIISSTCNMVEKTSVELTKDEIKSLMDGKEVAKAKYKIEDKKLYVREKDEDEWEEIGTYEKGTIVETISPTVKVYLKK